MQQLSSNSTEEKPKCKASRNVFYLADVSGTGYWRRILPIVTTDAIFKACGIINTYTMDFVPDPRFYIGMNSVTVQRWINDMHRNAFEKFLLPVTRKTGTKLIYEIDDAMGGDDIPLYNRGHDAFAKDNIQANIKYMLNAVDLVTVTTPYIKEYYHKKYGVPLEKIVAVPNLLSRMWFGDRYDVPRKLAQFNHYKSKPRIGIISSLSHYNTHGATDKDGIVVKDDFDEISDVILDTLDDFQWVVIGYLPENMRQLAVEGKIQCFQMTPITNYPSMLEHLQLQAVVAPIQDNEFNRCKSPIKFLECAASGIPLYASRMLPYEGVVPDDFLFSTKDELKEKLKKLKFSSSGVYQKIIEANWKWLNSPIRYGDFDIKNWWMEDNIGVWVSLFASDEAKEKMNNEMTVEV